MPVATHAGAGLSTDGLIERRELEEAATRALQILEERWRESSDDEESPPQSKPKTKISRKTRSQKPKPRGYIAPAAAEIEVPAAPRASRLAIHLSAAAAGLLLVVAVLMVGYARGGDVDAVGLAEVVVRDH